MTILIIKIDLPTVPNLQETGSTLVREGVRIKRKIDRNYLIYK